MKQVITAFVMIMVAGSMFWGVSKEVRAEKKESPELAKLLGFDTCYDCGDRTEDGVLEFKSDTHSLKKGDIVEMQVIYNADKDNVTGGLSLWDFYITHDIDVLEYLGVEMKDEYRIKYMPSMSESEYDEEGSIRSVSGFLTGRMSEGFEENDCLITVRYKVKKSVPATQLYVDTLKYENAVSHNGANLYEMENGTVVCSDVFTVNIEDNTFDSSLALSTTSVQGSKEIVIPINIEKNDGFNLLGLTLNYDTSLFTYDSLEINDSLKSKISLDSIYEAPGSGRIKASFIALEDISDVGDFLKLKLKVKDGVSAGTTSNIRVEITQVGNKAETSISGTGTTCAVSITDASGGEEQQPTLGDVNADKKVDLVDAVYILQYYNQVREFTKVQETAADVDKNGTVNLVDALNIMKHFNGEITGF